jgi:probable HAF family extracellular repeat protein
MGQVSVHMCKRVEFRRYPSVLSFLLILGSACYILATQPAEAQTFTVHELTLGGSRCRVAAISNGRAVGWATTPGDAKIHAFTWTEAGGMVDLGTLGGTRAEAGAVDGDRVVGASFTRGNAEIHAFSWTPTEGMRDLGTLGGTFGGADGVSGGEVVGTSTTASGELHAFRWTAASRMVDLGTLSRGTESSAVRVHQGLIAGFSTTHGDANRTRRPVAWNAAGEIIDIVGEPFDLLSGGFVRGNGEAVDVRDGVVVGFSRISTPDLDEHAFAWTAATGKVDLGTLPGDNVSFAHGTSNGQVVGFSSGFQGGSVGHPFSWTPTGGMIDLGTLGGHAEGNPREQREGRRVVLRRCPEWPAGLSLDGGRGHGRRDPTGLQAERSPLASTRGAVSR